MSRVTPDDLAYGVRFALEHGDFDPADRLRLQHLLTRWDAQRTRPNPAAAIIRQWNSDRAYFLKTLQQLDSTSVYQMAESVVAFHRQRGGTLTVEQQLAAWQRAVVAQQCASRG